MQHESDNTPYLTPDDVERLLRWYEKEHRMLPWREDRDPYHVWISEIMLQQTRVAAVIPYYQRFMQELPDIRSLAEVPEERLMKLWEGLGYYSRARNLKKAAIEIMEHHGGTFPGREEEILGLSGIGPYTAGAIGSICFGLPTPAVDGNVLRVCTRISADPSGIYLTGTKKRIEGKLRGVYEAADREQRMLLTQSLMELGAVTCVPKGAPDCGACPLSHICRAKENGDPEAYPVKAKPKKRRIEERTLFLLRGMDEEETERIAIHRRESTGLLAGLWEFPALPGKLTLPEILKWTDEWGLGEVVPRAEITYRHIFSHVEWHMKGILLECRAAGKDPSGAVLKEIGAVRWVTRQELVEQVAIPSAFALFLKLILM